MKKQLLASIVFLLVTLFATATEPTQTTFVLSPVYDLQFRKNNTAQSGTAPTFEIRHLTVGDHGFAAGLQFDLSSVSALSNNIDSVVLRLTTEFRSNGVNVQIKPFANNWTEAGGSTYSYEVMQTAIEAAVAAGAIATFFPNTGGNQIFEWRPCNPVNINNWQNYLNITDYVKSYIATSQTAIMGLLLTPQSTNISANRFFSKDAVGSNYGTSTTISLDANCTNIGTVTRWSRIVELLALTNVPITTLYPELRVYVRQGTTTGIAGVNENINMKFDQTSNNLMINFSGNQKVAELRIINLTGVSVYQQTITRDNSTVSIEKLPRGLYIVTADGDNFRQSLKIVK